MKIRAVGWLLAAVTAASAGPPFLTDDPEPVEWRHWEVYIASQYANTPGGPSGTAPHVEVNYGAAPNLQLHVIVPMAFARPTGGRFAWGPGDVELGAQFRFVQESRSCPMIGTFPHVELPAGAASHGLGFGHPQVFVPLWLQKSWGPWTTYGGGGYQINPGVGNANSWFGGWEVQRDLNAHWTVGGELYDQTSTAAGGANSSGFNVGGQFNFDDSHHLLFSAGRGFGAAPRFTAYAAFQWTLGPHEKKAKP